MNNVVTTLAPSFLIGSSSFLHVTRTTIKAWMIFSVGLEPASVRVCVFVCVRASTLSNMNISETSWPIIIKFHQKHHWGGGLTALGFGLDRIRTLVTMTTDNSHRVIMGKTL